MRLHTQRLDTVQQREMAVSSLRYRPHAQPPEESKFGYVKFSGLSTEYHHWLFRTQLKLKMSKTEDIPQVVMHTVENLRGEALQVAVEIGIDELIKTDGSGGEKLLLAMQRHIFPVAQHEAKELYREGHTTKDGSLARQQGEPMQSNILRRKRWSQLL